MAIIKKDDNCFDMNIEPYLAQLSTKWSAKELSQDTVGAVVKNIQ